MKNETTPAAQSMPSQRRIPTQDGPWTVSVADNPHDASAYSIYIKTPTHNMTLTRSALEIVELHSKLRDAAPARRLPALPIDAAAIPAPPKRKSAFLNTLSRLASPANKARPAHTQSQSSAASSPHATPVASPAAERGDPFASALAGAADAARANGGAHANGHAHGTSVGLAAYLTTLANDSELRQARPWRRFVRVRTDDLQSVRVERAVKRVRSDLAAHVGAAGGAENTRSIGQVVFGNGEGEEEAPSVNGDGAGEEDEGEGAQTGETAQVNGVHGKKSGPNGVVPNGVPNGAENEEVENFAADAAIADAIAHGASDDGTVEEMDRAPTPRSPKPALAAEPGPSASVIPNGVDVHAAASGANGAVPEDNENENDVEEDATAPATPVLADMPAHAARIPRSQSADPTSRAQRVFFEDGTSSRVSASHGTETPASSSADDTSDSATAVRKKRSKSADPRRAGSSRKVRIDDFEMLRVLGKGCAGKVLLVRHKPSAAVYALKAITKRHVLAHQELQHTLTEQAVLKRMAGDGAVNPFVVKLHFSFHDKENLFLVMDFHPGGDLATQLARWGRLGRDRARFYAAEIVEGVEGLHAAGVIYRDLKPENILIAADGHIILTDFGLSKEFPRRTSPITAPPTPSGFRGDFVAGSPSPAVPHWMKNDLPGGWVLSPNDTTSTFCGTAEYLAPEVIQGQPYSYEVDWWSFGTMLYEMLTGITPFWANNHSDMYYRVLQDELQFPEDRTMDQDTKSLIRGLLQRAPALRMKEPRIKKHPYFSMIDWSHVYYKRYIPPYIPPIDPSNASDTQNFDDTFLDMEPVINDENENDHTDTDQEGQTDSERADEEDGANTPSQSRSPSAHLDDDESVDVFDGYSFKGRHSIIMDDEEDDGDEEDEDEEEGVSPSTASTDDIEATEEPAKPAEPSTDVVEVAEPSAAPVEEITEPKTPEARPSTALPEPTSPSSPAEEKAPSVARKPSVRHSEEVTVIEAPPAAPLAPEPEEIKPVKAPPKVQPRPNAGRQRGRREKSGIPALDRDLSDAHDESEPTTEREDDEWDFVEAEATTERNGAKGTSLFARGVVDRYKLAVFRKSTPRRTSAARNFLGPSTESELTSPIESPTSPDKQRRGRTPGLTFRKHPKQFLRQRSPHSTLTSPSLKTLSNSASNTLTASSSGLLTPTTSTQAMTPSLRSKESATSVGSPSESSDTSINGDAKANGDHTIKAHSSISVDDDKQKSKVLKKYKEGAEKVLSIFQSPR
ncbi:hypothetical protein WOLCODRAFT_135720 [Wolfiporia cocos MD-104 SS10]|uniref:Kinase-like protein n=1 Tax=Wolfiporia cocos (strain MD-104) TaxID=742152 RepID=A0A2H3J6T4_WOLCO|nr:hypothetical protein WOLCODRAFT_135720 [Wolfiporia cocos MD-104 SS10]